MRKFFALLAAAAFTAFASCTVEEPELPQEPDEPKTEKTETGPREIVIRATQESQDGTKTTRNEETGASLWTIYDAINVFYGSGSAGGSRFSWNSPTGPTESAVAEFSGTIDTSTPSLEFWGLYPYDSSATCDGSSITTTISSLQSGDFRIFPALGHSSTQDMAFYNICGGLCFSVKRSDITRITIRSNNGEPLAGSFRVGLASDGKTPEIKEVLSGTDVITVSPGGFFTPDKNYYVTIFPGTLAGGFTMTFETQVMEGTYNRTKSTPINRSRFGGLAGIDEAANVVFSYKSGNISITDAQFKLYLTDNNFDSDGDGEISYTEAVAITAITVDGNDYTVSSLKGIECMPHLSSLSVTGMSGLTVANVGFNTELTSIDLSNNALKSFGCSYLPVETLNLSGNPAMTILSADYCHLSSLDISGCTGLTQISCGYGNSLATLDVSDCENLELLFLRDNGTLTSLDVSNNPKLRSLNVMNNKLTSLILSENPQLQSLFCEINLLTSLDVSANPALKYMHCGQNSLATLDVSANPSLRTLDCTGSPLLTDIWLKTGQTITTFNYDTSVATLHYKD